MKYRVCNRFRFTIFVAITIVMITLIANLILGFNTVQGSTITEYKTVHISSGDTLWTIAERNSSSNVDIRKVVYEIEMINDISASDLQAGMTIQVPIYK